MLRAQKLKAIRIFILFLFSSWCLAVSSERGGLDGWRIVPRANTGTGLWTVAGACKELTRVWGGPGNAYTVA